MTKTVTFAITHFTVAFGVAYGLTGDLVVGGTVALVEPAVNTLAYHFHEKVWTRLGKNKKVSVTNGNACDLSPPPFSYPIASA